MADRPVLVCREGPLAGQVHVVRDGETRIGRSPECELVLDDPDVSRSHASLLYDNGSLWLRDAGSRNGVIVNGKRVADHRALKLGDEVRIASSLFEVTWEDATDTVEAQPPEATEASEEAEATTTSGMWRRWFGK